MKTTTLTKIAGAMIMMCMPSLSSAAPVQVAGVYPSLAMYNDENECGTGAVVPWADRLWVITYAPHKPLGSSDKLCEITPELQQIIRPESVGGTPANRMIHRESDQLSIGPYLIDSKRTVRVLPPERMPGRLTATARHLVAPASKIYIATSSPKLPARMASKAAETPRMPRSGPWAGMRSPSCSCFSRAANGTSSVCQREATAMTAPTAGTRSGHASARLARTTCWQPCMGPSGDSLDTFVLGRPVVLEEDGKRYRLPRNDAYRSYEDTALRVCREVVTERDLLHVHGTFYELPARNAQGMAKVRPVATHDLLINDYTAWRGFLLMSGVQQDGESGNDRIIKSEDGNACVWIGVIDELWQLGKPRGEGGPWAKTAVTAGTEHLDRRRLARQLRCKTLAREEALTTRLLSCMIIA